MIINLLAISLGLFMFVEFGCSAAEKVNCSVLTIGAAGEDALLAQAVLGAYPCPRRPSVKYKRVRLNWRAA